MCTLPADRPSGLATDEIRRSHYRPPSPLSDLEPLGLPICTSHADILLKETLHTQRLRNREDEEGAGVSGSRYC